ncbi:unnamed protein product [Owenia fusiformis]|uniref:Calx-beta domain-containing protein n=1 Tax=Owenia fusiformis TaxID=6347 RepID=A0A8S4PV33_OWEFU|nr:unnamed protein product [Owenia fusiformis]
MSWNYRTNYSSGYVVEYVPLNATPCASWLLFIPAENLWPAGLRAFLYLLAMIYLFMGIAISSDLFMCSIEAITSKKKKVIRFDEETQQKVEREVLVWNETVANLTLMALGSSAPEILIAVGETLQNLNQIGNPNVGDGLGTFTIIGSAAFNLLIITGICIVSVPSPQVKPIKEIGVFCITAVWSIFAYFWMLIVLQWVSPQIIEPWEAFVTLAFFPIMVVMSYAQDSGWWCKKRKSVGTDSQDEVHNVRIVNQNNKNSLIHGPSKELSLLEKEHEQRHSHANLKNVIVDSNNRDPDVSSGDSEAKLVRVRPSETAPQTFARARFRHAAVRSMMGGRRSHPKSAPSGKLKMVDVVETVRTDHHLNILTPSEDLFGKFTFAAPSYSVLESAGILEIDVLFHRRPPPKSYIQNGVSNGKTTETSFTNPISTTAEEDEMVKGTVSIDFETREGSAKINKDFKYTQGSLVFSETEYRKSITIPIINDNQYEADADFYVILKNAHGGSGIGDPSVTRVTIIDDDEPGEFTFDRSHYAADLKSGMMAVTVVRQHGCDGTVTVEYSTVDGTARGGPELTEKLDYASVQGVLTFKHGETSKQIQIDVNKEAKSSKNFIVTLRNPSLGAKIGEHSAAVANISTDVIADRIADILDDEEEEVTWGGQFRNAMSVECDKDDDGVDIPLKWYDYTLHFLTFFWKVIFAFIPPKQYLGAWPTFISSLVFTGVLTLLVEQLGHLLGCTIGIKTAVTGITIVALGTSLPDTFASRTAALHDQYADAAIGNITGSNSVNVFLGLGLPWVISVIYGMATNKTFYVPTANLFQSVLVFAVCGVSCIIMLFIRRKFIGGELGGANKLIKWGCCLFLFLLWFIYILISSLNAYGLIEFNL